MSDTHHSYDADQVRERTDLLTLIGQYVALKKRGGRYTGLCPFHQEKSPSFSVDPQKGFWHCFGCGKGGDAFSFLMQYEKLTFPEALERLAERAGIQPTQSTEAPRRKEERDLLFEVNAAAAEAFRKGLKGAAGAGARAYLAQRGITPAHAEQFGLGYAPPMWDALVHHLQKRGYAPEMMLKADLARTRTQSTGNFDRFRNRLMIPIHDRQGRVVAFGGRALAPDDQPKYLNTGETPLFHKGRLLYAFHLARDPISKRGRAIVTEGYFDTIACHLAGFTETVATLGTALSEEHVRLLRPMVERVYLVFDADSAGLNAALRSQAIFRQAEVDVRIVRLPGGHDPDTFLREMGAEAFERCLTEALSPVAFELERLLAEHPARDVESRTRLFRAAARLLRPLPGLERTEYTRWLADRWLRGAQGNVADLQQAILGEVAALDRAPHRGNAPHIEEAPPPDEEATLPLLPIPTVPLEREVLRAMVQHADFAAQAVILVPLDAFTHPTARVVFQAFCRQVDQEKTPDPRHLAGDNTAMAAVVAALAVADPYLGFEVSPTGAMDRLLEEYEVRTTRPCEVPLEDRAAAEEITATLKERSRRAQQRAEQAEPGVKHKTTSAEPVPERIRKHAHPGQ